MKYDINIFIDLGNCCSTSKCIFNFSICRKNFRLV